VSRFFGLDLLAAPGRVFTPRPATERLVEAALALAGDGPCRIADAGTGAGAIAVAVAVHAPGAEVWATDTSPAAVALARANAKRHAVAGRVHVMAGDLLAPVGGPLDLVLANLPDLPSTPAPLPEYEDEPPDAVYAPGDGLDPYRRLLVEAERRLAPGGVVLLQFQGAVFEGERRRLDALLGQLERAQRLPAAD
jgi:release factor glutamine methyltransferase